MDYKKLNIEFKKLLNKIEKVNGLYSYLQPFYDSDHPLHGHWIETVHLEDREKALAQLGEIIDDDGYWDSFDQGLHELVQVVGNNIVNKYLIKLLIEIEAFMYQEYKYGQFDYMVVVEGNGNAEVKNRHGKLVPFLKGVHGFYSRYEQIRNDIFCYTDTAKFEKVSIFEDKFVVADKFLELKKEFDTESTKMDPYPGSSVPVKALITYVQIETGQIRDFPSSGNNRKEAIMEYGNKNFGCSGANFLNCYYKIQNGVYPTSEHIEKAERFLGSNETAMKYLISLRPNKRARK